LPKKVFSAMLRACLEDETDIADFEDEPEVPTSGVRRIDRGIHPRYSSINDGRLLYKYIRMMV
jgi:hypothetical protein